MPNPSVTFVIPCHNHGRFVGKAVASCLAQVDAEARVVVVDDGSTDGTTPGECDRCADPRVRVIHQANGGLPAARNRGAGEVDSEYLVFLDADDWVAPRFATKLAVAIEAQDASGRGLDVSHAYCQERLVEKGSGVWRVPDWDPLLMMLTNIHPVTTLVRTERFHQAGGFTTTMTSGYEDWDLWLKFVERGWRGVRVREPLFIWRRHSHSTMIMEVIKNHEALYRRIVEQHRALYDRHGPELLVRVNTMMRRFDMNWLDESGDPINLLAARRVRDMYESMAAVRLHHAIHRTIEALPRPLAGARRVLGALKRVMPGDRSTSI